MTERILNRKMRFQFKEEFTFGEQLETNIIICRITVYDNEL